MRLIDMSAPSVKRPMPRISMAVATTNESISPASTGTSTKQTAMTIRLMGSTEAAASFSFSSNTCFWYKGSLLLRYCNYPPVYQKSAALNRGKE